MAAFPEIPAKLPGVLIDCDPQSPNDQLPLTMMNPTGHNLPTRQFTMQVLMLLVFFASPQGYQN
jgi:hypothetical protein